VERDGLTQQQGGISDLSDLERDHVGNLVPRCLGEQPSILEGGL